MPQTSRLLMPPAHLAGCIFAAIVRDTRDQTLSDLDRFNHFPASPLVAVTRIFFGDIRIVPGAADISKTNGFLPEPQMSVAGPQSRPVTSWNPGPVCAVTIGMYPEAWTQLTGQPAADIAERTGQDLLDPVAGAMATSETIDDFWETFCAALAPLWLGSSGAHFGAGPARLGNWAKHLAAKAAISGPGRSMRAAERRVKRWAGQSQQSLAFYARLDALHEISVQRPEGGLAAIAHDAGFADQSHMGRTVRRATGVSPARLNRLVDTQEAYWCYRLLGERF